MTRRRAKIVCTLGPASDGKKIIYGMIRQGMDVARVNFSHGSHDSHRKIINIVRDGSRKFGRAVAVLQDLQGIKIRTGSIRGGGVELRRGKTVSLFPGSGTGDENAIYVSYPYLLKDARVGDKILLDDGMIQMKVTEKTRKSLITKVLEGGRLKERKGVNVPGMKITQKPFTEKDRSDLTFGLKMHVDYVAVSFVRTASDIEIVSKWMAEKGRSIPIIAKIEKPEALLNIDAILEVSDGIMVARGDLGVEVAPEEVPLIQKSLIDLANRKGKIVITATQMLESMTSHLRPTRAETTDVANAVIDGTDVLMLSAETSVGNYPDAALRMMDRIIRHTERSQKIASSYVRGNTYAEALAEAACGASEDIGAKVLVAFTRSGFTARLVSKFRPSVPIIAFTSEKTVLTQLSFYWGVVPQYMKPMSTIDKMLREVERVLMKEKIVKKGDRIVLIASSPLSTKRKTNFMKLHQIGGE